MAAKQQEPRFTALFPAKSEREATSSVITIDGLDVYEMRNTLRGTGTGQKGGDPLWRDEKSDLAVTSDLKKRKTLAKIATGLDGFLRDGDTWLAGGQGSLYSSRDGGRGWRMEPVPLDDMILSIVRHEGTLWIAGAKGGLAYLDGKKWIEVERPKASRDTHLMAGVKLAYPVFGQTRLKVVGGELYSLGKGLWRIDSKTKNATLVVPSKSLLVDLEITPAGTLIAVGTEGTRLRRAGKKWETHQAGTAAYVGIVAMTGGLLLVCSDGPPTLFWSTDDGATFTPLAKQPKTDDIRAHLAVADGHGGALVAGWRGWLVRVSNDALGPWDPKNRKTASAKPVTVKPAKPEPRRTKSAKDEASFLADIIASPDDDAPRLVYADWLLEHGDPRGEFIQIQCKLQRPIYGAQGKYADEYEDYEPPADHLALEKREKELLKEMTASLAPLRKYFYQWAWRRGFLSSLTVNASFFAGAKVVLGAHPVEKLSITGLKKRDLPELPKLDLGTVRWLDLSEQRLGPKDVPLICGKNYERVESLFLWDNPIDDDGAVALATKSHFTHLRELGLLECAIGDVGVGAIAASKILTKLEKLDLAENPFTDDGAMAIANSKTLENLQIVNVGWTPKKTFSKPTVAALKKRFEIEDVLGWEPYN